MARCNKHQIAASMLFVMCHVHVWSHGQLKQKEHGPLRDVAENFAWPALLLAVTQYTSAVSSCLQPGNVSLAARDQITAPIGFCMLMPPWVPTYEAVPYYPKIIKNHDDFQELTDLQKEPMFSPSWAADFEGSTAKIPGPCVHTTRFTPCTSVALPAP